MVDLESLAVSNDGRFLLRNEAHFIDGVLGADFVDNTDKGVGDGDKNKEEVFVGANQDNHSGQDEVDEVEDGKGVF